MKIIIIQSPKSLSTYEKWILEILPYVEIIIITDKNSIRKDYSKDIKVIKIDNYESVSATVQILDICLKFNPKFIYSNSEIDVLRTAEIRTILHLEGQHYDAARLFIDKLQMKQLFKNNMAQIIPYAPANAISDVIKFIKNYKKIVIKPRISSGSVDINIFDDISQFLKDVINNTHLLNKLNNGLLFIEKFIYGQIYHIDILLNNNNKIVLFSPSKYIHPPHEFRHKNVGSIMLDEFSHEYKILFYIVQNMIDNFPYDHKTNVLHLEIFKSDDTPQTFWFGEIACRVGGGLIKDSIIHTYNIDINKYSLLLNMNLLPQYNIINRVQEQTGWLLITSNKKNISNQKFQDIINSQNGIIKYNFNSNNNNESINSVDAIAKILVKGNSYNDILNKFKILLEKL